MILNHFAQLFLIYKLLIITRMKKIYLLAMAVIGLQTISTAQTPCDAGRYSTKLFPNVTVTSGVNFGQNTDF